MQALVLKVVKQLPNTNVTEIKFNHPYIFHLPALNIPSGRFTMEEYHNVKKNLTKRKVSGYDRHDTTRSS